MSKAETDAILEERQCRDARQVVDARGLSASVKNTLMGKGITTASELMDTDAFRTVASGRYDIDTISEVNGIPVAAFRWLMSEIPERAEGVPACVE